MLLSFSFNALFLHIVPSCFPASILVLACLQWLALQPSDPEVETIVFQPPFLEGGLLVSGRVNNWRLTYTFPRIYDTDEILMMSNHQQKRNISWNEVSVGFANPERELREMRKIHLLKSNPSQMTFWSMTSWWQKLVVDYPTSFHA